MLLFVLARDKIYIRFFLIFRSAEMNLSNLNPSIHSVALYERLGRSGECIAYDSRLIYLVSGELTYTIGGGKRERMAPGNLLYIPAGVPYALKSKYMRAVFVNFDFTSDKDEVERLAPVSPDAFSEELCRRPDGFGCFEAPLFLADIEAERDNFIRMSHIFTSGEGNYLAELSAMLKLILLKLAEHTDEHALPSSMVENLDEYIRDNIRDEISNTELGAIFGYHPFYISRVLKEKRGITLHQYVIAFRLKYAREMLECTDKSVAEIAEETGFTDASYFTKSFKAAYGSTPKEYRSKFKEEFI